MLVRWNNLHCLSVSVGVIGGMPNLPLVTRAMLLTTVRQKWRAVASWSAEVSNFCARNLVWSNCRDGDERHK